MVARHVVPPAGIVASEWPSVRETCHRLGWGFDGWQDGAGMLILSQRADGEYAADTIVISIPRQAGKTYLIACIIFALCLMKPGLKVIWTAQVKDTALETFEQFFTMSQRPTVKPHIDRTPQGKGDEAIIFGNGSSIEFGARDSGFGRGRTDVDIIVYDEGQHLSTEALENMSPAQNVAANPLTFVMGTPPRPRDKGEYFTLVRQEALDGESEGTLYIEMSADRGADPMDREQWRKANPSFPHRTSERALLRLRKKLKNPDSWRREALGIWDEISVHQAVVKASRWDALLDVGPADSVRPTAFGVDASHGREFSVSACWLDGANAHAEEVWAGTDEAALVGWLVQRSRPRTPIVIDAMSPAAAIVSELRRQHRTVIVTGPSDMGKACGLWLGEVTAGRLTHAGQESITQAVAVALRRAIGNAGAWGWDRKDDTVNIAPLVAHTLARYGASRAPKPTGGRRSSGRRRAVVA